MAGSHTLLTMQGLSFRLTSQRKQHDALPHSSLCKKPYWVNLPPIKAIQANPQNKPCPTLPSRALKSGCIFPTKRSVLSKWPNNCQRIIRICNFCLWLLVMNREEYTLIFKAQSWRCRAIKNLFWLLRMNKGHRSHKEKKIWGKKLIQWAYLSI